MKFIVDAHFPRRLAHLLQEAGYDAIHTLDLSQGNRTSDSAINELSSQEQRVVITKDADFVDSFWLRQEPWKLLLVSTGNIRNAALLAIFQANLEKVVTGFDTFDFIEVNRADVIFHA
jgi:predicted nuclease of predicted toxin-antitoxin system